MTSNADSRCYMKFDWLAKNDKPIKFHVRFISPRLFTFIILFLSFYYIFIIINKGIFSELSETRKSTDTNCKIEIHFSIQATEFLLKYTLLCFQISGRLKLSLINMNIKPFEQVSLKANKRYK